MQLQQQNLRNKYSFGQIGGQYPQEYVTPRPIEIKGKITKENCSAEYMGAFNPGKLFNRS